MNFGIPFCLGVMLLAGHAIAAEPKKAVQAENDVVVARVNGETIPLSRIKAFYEKAKANFGNQPFEQVYPAVLNELVAQKVLTLDARKAGLERDPEVAREITDATATILWRTQLSRKVAPQITDAAISEKYLELVKTYEGKEEIHARHILVTSESDAINLIARLRKGADFATLAKDVSTDKGSAANGGDLGFFGEGRMVPEFSAAAFALKPGEISDKPVKSQFGWHVIKVEERRKATLPLLDQVKSQIIAHLQQQKAKEVIEVLKAGNDITLFNPDGSPLTPKP